MFETILQALVAYIVAIGLLTSVLFTCLMTFFGSSIFFSKNIISHDESTFHNKLVCCLGVSILLAFMIISGFIIAGGTVWA